MGQTGQRYGKSMKGYKGIVKWRGEHSLFSLHFITPDHELGWDQATVVIGSQHCE